MVKERNRPTGLLLAAPLSFVIGVACAQSDDEPASRGSDVPSSAPGEPVPSATDPELPPIVLPDLSTTDAFVSDQIRAEYAALMEILETPGSGPIVRGEAYSEVGRLLMAAALLDPAEPFLLRAQAELPGDTRWPYYLGHLYSTQGALDKSVAAFERVLELRHDDAVTMISLGDVHLLRGDPDAAEPLFRQQLTLQPNSVVANVGLGRAALAKSEYARAVRHLEAALALSENRAVGVHYPLALAYRGLGEQDKAEEHLRQRADVRVLPEDPLMESLGELLESPTAYENRGNRALSDRRWAEAAEHFRMGLSMDPDNPTMRHRLGTALYQLGDSSAAAAQWQQIVEANPAFSLAHFSLGVLLEGAGLRSQAIEHFQAAVEHQATYVEARLGLAALLRRSGRLEESLSQYDQVAAQAISGDPRFEEAPFGAAITLVRMGRYQEASNRLRQGMSEYPGTPFFAHALARLWSGAPDADVRDGRAALSLLRSLPEEFQRIDYGESLAMALAEAGQFTEAAALQREAIDLATRARRNDLLPRMRARLTRYEDSRPWRSPDPVEFDPFLERTAAT